WTEQPGFPVVVASLVNDARQRELKLEPVRFTLNDPQAAPLSWKIPLTLGDPTQPATPPVALLLEGPATVAWPAAAATIKANLGRILGRFGDRAVVAECMRRFEAFLQQPASLTGDLRESVLLIVGRHAARPVYAQLHALAQAARTTEDKRAAYAAMQASLDPE